MSRSVTFNGITKIGTGGITRVNAEGLNQITTGPTVMALIGEADGGAPGSEGVVSLRDPATVTDLFKSGPLTDAIKLAFQSSGDPLIPGGASQVLVYKTNASTQSHVELPSTTINALATTITGAGSTSTVLDLTAPMVASAYVDKWASITIASLSATFVRRITANTTTAITVTPALPAVPAAADVVNIRSSLIELTSVDYGLHTNTITADLNYDSATESYSAVVEYAGETQVSPTLGGIDRNYLHVLYLGGSLADSTLVTASSSVTVVNVTAASLINAAHANQTMVLKDSGGVFKAAAKITTNTTGSITLTKALSAVPVVGDIVEILAVTAATGTITGASGVASLFATSITGVTGDNLSIAITASMTVNELAALINANTSYVATVPSQINGQTALAKEFDFGTGTATVMQYSHLTTVSTSGFRQDLNEVVDWFNDECEFVSAARVTTDVADGGDLNAASYDPPFTMYGGTRGISTNTTFQAGFDAMLLHVVNQVVPLIDDDLSSEGLSSTATWASVSQQLVDHVVEARGAAGLERGGFIGFRGTKTEYIAACNSLNDADVHCVGQGVYIVDPTGTLVARGPRELAVMGASMRLGATEIGEPLTHKYIRTSGVIQLDATWDPASTTDAGDLVFAGALFAENIAGRGTRWARDLTTWVKDDNLAYTDGSVRDVVRYVAYGLRTFLEDRFLGRKATPASIASIKAAATALLETYRSREIIVDSTDPATGVKVRAYHNLKVTSSGDVARVNVGIFPVPGINFLLNDIYLSLPTQSA